MVLPCLVRRSSDFHSHRLRHQRLVAILVIVVREGIDIRFLGKEVTSHCSPPLFDLASRSIASLATVYLLCFSAGRLIKTARQPQKNRSRRTRCWPDYLDLIMIA